MLLFDTIAYKRNLSNIIDDNLRTLLYEQINIPNRRTKVQNALRQLGYKDLIYNKPKIKPPKLRHIEFIKTKKPKYKHKQPVFKPREPCTSECLLSKNTKILHNLYTNNYKNISEAISDYEKYKLIQSDLKGRGIKCEKFRLTKNSRLLIISLLGDKCCKCGSKYNLTLHHIKSKEDEDRDNIEYLQLQCRTCHNSEHDIVAKDMQLGNLIEVS